jgi:hypothetical protein
MESKQTHSPIFHLGFEVFGANKSRPINRSFQLDMADCQRWFHCNIQFSGILKRKIVNVLVLKVKSYPPGIVIAYEFVKKKGDRLPMFYTNEILWDLQIILRISSITEHN